EMPPRQVLLDEESAQESLKYRSDDSLGPAARHVKSASRQNMLRTPLQTTLQSYALRSRHFSVSGPQQQPCIQQLSQHRMLRSKRHTLSMQVRAYIQARHRLAQHELIDRKS